MPPPVASASAAPPDVIWRARSDGVKHAFPKRGRQRAVGCYTPHIEPKFDHPERSRCASCVAATQPPAPGEQTEAWGK